MKRRPPAVLAADVAGYGTMVGADADARLERLKGHLSELINPKIREYCGRLIPACGDDMLVEFPTVLDAVHWAFDVQRGILEREQRIAAEQRIRFRIGIDLGDIVVNGDTTFGDSISTAIQLKALAEPGGIAISRPVRDQVCDELPYEFADLGEQCVGDTRWPARMDLPRADAAPPALATLLANAFRPPRTASLPRLSIVVLPFANLSVDPEQQYFADCITEDLTTDLSRLHEMLVISTVTAFAYRDKSIAAQVGRELNVRYALRGSIPRADNRLARMCG